MMGSRGMKATKSEWAAAAAAGLGDEGGVEDKGGTACGIEGGLAATITRDWAACWRQRS